MTGDGVRSGFTGLPLLVLLLVLGAVTTACAGSEDGSGPSPPDAPALDVLLLDQVGEGYVLQPEEMGGTGPSDLEAAVRDSWHEEPESARAFLEDNGFVVGHKRLWLDEDGAGVQLFLYEFAGSAGAASHSSAGAAAVVQGDGGDPALQLDPIAVIPGSTVLEGSQGVVAVAYATGVYSVAIMVATSDRATTEGFARSLALDQYSRLQ